MKKKIKVTVLETYKVYQWRHFEVDEDKIVKNFGSLKKFEKEKPLDFMELEHEIDIREIIEQKSKFEFILGNKDVSNNVEIYDKEVKN